MCCGTVWGKMYVQHKSELQWQQCKGLDVLAELNKFNNSKTNNPFCKGRHSPNDNKEQKKNWVELEIWVKHACLKTLFLSGDGHCPPSLTAVAFTWLARKQSVLHAAVDANRQL